MGGEPVVYLVISFFMTLIYPTRLMIDGGKKSPETKESRQAESEWEEKPTNWKTGFELGVGNLPLEGLDQGGMAVYGGVAIERTLAPTVGLRATLQGVSMSGGSGAAYGLGVPITVLSSYSAWGAKERAIHFAYLFIRPEVGYLRYNAILDGSEVDGIAQASYGASVGSGYRLKLSEKNVGVYYWAQSWVGYNGYTDYQGYGGRPGVVGGFDFGIEF